MPQTPAQKAMVGRTVAKLRAKNQAQNKQNTAVPNSNTQVVDGGPQQVAEAIQKATSAVVSAGKTATPPASSNQKTTGLPSADVISGQENPNATAMPDQVIPQRTEDTKMVFGDDAVNRNLQDPNFITNRDTQIIKELNSTGQYGDMSDFQLKKTIEGDLTKRGADMTDPRAVQTINRIVSGIREQQPLRGADDYYSVISQGGILPGKEVSNPNAQYAMNTFKQVQNFATKNTQQIAQELATGKLLIGGNLYNKLVQAGYGAKLQEAQNLKKFNFKQDVMSFLVGSTGANPDKPLGEQKTDFPQHENYEESISQEFTTKPKSYVDMFRERVTENQELNDAKDVGRSTLEQINEKRRLLTDFANDIKTQIIAGGGTISKGYLALLAEEKSKPIVRELEGLQDQYASEMALVKDLTDTAKMEFELEMKQYSEDREVALEQMRYERDTKKQLMMMGVQDQYAQAAEGRAFGRDLKKMEISDQYAQAGEERSFAKQLKLGDINYERDLEKMKLGFANDIQKLKIGNQMDIEKMGLQNYYEQQNMQYKYDMENQQAISEAVGPVDVSQIEQARAELGYAPGRDNPQVAKLCLPDGQAGGQCAKYVNNIYQKAGGARPFGGADQSINGKIAVTKSKQRGSDVPVIGGSVVSDFGIKDPKTGQNYGHVEIIVGINPENGNLIVSGSNFTNDQNSPKYEKSYTREIGRDEPFIKGFTKAPGAEIQKSDTTKLAESILNGIGSYPSKNSKNYEKVVNEVSKLSQQRIDSTDDTNLQALYASAKYDKETDATTIKSITDQKTVLGQLGSLQTQLVNMKKEVGPIEGYLRSKNPYDVDAATVAAQINGLAPKVARGVFGEVGVLTDQDIARYMKTIPNNKMTTNVSTIIGDLLKVAVYKSFINTVTTNAQAGRNMSNFVGDYEKAKKFLESKGVSAYVFDEMSDPYADE